MPKTYDTFDIACSEPLFIGATSDDTLRCEGTACEVLVRDKLDTGGFPCLVVDGGRETVGVGLIIRQGDDVGELGRDDERGRGVGQLSNVLGTSVSVRGRRKGETKHPKVQIIARA